ncbi:MAG: trigger factor, partial [Hyphomonas sp.]
MEERLMEVTQTKVEGLRRTFEVKVPASELKTRLDDRIEEIRPQMRLKGFRPGKVPAAHVRRMYGRDLMGELIDKLVNETNQKALEDNSLRPAGQPNVQMEADIEKVVLGEADLAYHMHVDIMPEFTPVDVATLTITRPVAEVAEESIEEALKRIADQNIKYEPRAEGEASQDGDAVVVDFVGKIDGEVFPGGSATDSRVALGDGAFIPGFEDQLVGVKAGDEVEIKVTFPKDYGAEHLAGKDAVFETKVKAIQAPQESQIDDGLAERLGLSDLEALK